MKRNLKRIPAILLAVMLILLVCKTEEIKVSAASYGVQTVTNSDLRNSYSSGNSLQPLKGIDVSKWQENIDWRGVRATGVEFAIIQAGNRNQDTGIIAEDPMFTVNAAGAQSAGMPIGLYFFSQAVTVEEAVEEADWLIEKAKNYNIAFPLVMDFEYRSNANGNYGRLYEANLSVDAATAIVDAFCSRIEASGYSSMFYCNSYMLNNKLDADALSAKHKLWLANYQNPAMTTYGNPTTVYKKAFTYFQFSCTGAVSGINTAVDLDYYYGDISMVLPYYSAVFDADFYASKHPELVNTYGYDSQALLKHFLNEGMAKGWQGCAGFDAKSYRARYADLNNAFGSDMKAYYLHYLGYGIAEGRDGSYSAEVNEPYCDIKYRTHIQNAGWQGWKANGETSGSEGQALRLEGLNIALDTNISGGVSYRTHVQDIGWQNWVSNGSLAGTSGMSKRLEAVQIQLTGELAERYDVYYRVHAQNIGWLDWAKNGESAGTQGSSLRLEAIQILLVQKNSAAPGSTAQPFKSLSVSVQTHVQNIGWQNPVTNGAAAGTTGQGLRVEAMKLSTGGFSGNILYRTHVQNIGWQDWVSDGALAGTQGRSLRLEALQVKLTGELADTFDVYYRVHAQNIGWMGWTKNGASAGTAGYSYRLEAIQIMLVPKGDAAPGSTAGAFRKK